MKSAAPRSAGEVEATSASATAAVSAANPAPPPGAGFPTGLANAYWFATFNALSYQIVLGSPVVLFAKDLGASATVLGIVAGMMPLLVIFQIPAANHIERVGYKRFVYAGWGIRVLHIFALALLPLAGGFLASSTMIALLLFLLFGFNLSRGISSAAWLPWITTLVPEAVRGKYLARDAACVHVASCVTLLLAAACLGGQPPLWRYAIIFGFSGLMGAASLTFLKRIPDVEPPGQAGGTRAPVPWRQIAAYAPFRKLLRMNVAWSIAYGGLGAFTVAFLKVQAGLSESMILLATGMAFLGGLAGLAYFESRTDHFGSKPVLTFCLCLWNGILLGWLALAARAFGASFGIVLFLELLMGFAVALVNMNHTRLAMQLAPVMGRGHFFALYSVVNNVTLGLAPIAWGLLMDAFGDRRWSAAGLELNRYSLFFAGALLAFLVTLALARRLDEPRARDMEELLREILRSPHRLWLRLWPRG
jgi:MFS family permease